MCEVVYMKYAPLKASFMGVSIIGFLVAVIYVREFSVNWAFAMGFVFGLMFIASLITMEKAPIGLKRR